MSEEANDDVTRDAMHERSHTSPGGASKPSGPPELPTMRSARVLRQGKLLKSPISISELKRVKNFDHRKAPIVPCPWPVEKLSEVPFDYSLSRTSSLITSKNVEEICESIARVLRKLGIKAEYDAVGAVAKCETSYFVKFTVSLFRGKGRFSNGTIVEVRRTYNSSLEYMADCRSILNAAEGNQHFECKVRRMKPITQLDCLKDFDQNQSIDYVKNALDCSEKHIQSEHTDVKILGLESIVSLLDQNNCSYSTVKRVYQSVLLGETNDGINKAVVSFLSEYSGLEDDKYEMTLRRLSLQVLYKSLEASQTLHPREGCSTALKENPWLVDSFVKILIQDLKNAKLNPHNALTASRCLNIMIPISTTVKENALYCGLLATVREANQSSKLYCDKTYNETKDLLKKLDF